MSGDKEQGRALAESLLDSMVTLQRSVDSLLHALSGGQEQGEGEAVEEIDAGLAAFEELSTAVGKLQREIETRCVELDRQAAARDNRLKFAFDDFSERTGSALGALLEREEPEPAPKPPEPQHSPAWLGACVAAGLALLAVGGGYAAGSRAGASWANSAAGQMAQGLDSLGSLQRLATCSGPGWHVEAHGEKNVCIPSATSDGGVYGWSVYAPPS